MRGSREISLVPSLHRASTDALITGSGLLQVRIMKKRSKVSVFGVQQHVYIYISLCCDSVHCTQLCLLCTTFFV